MSPQSEVEIKVGSYCLGRDPDTHNYVRGKCIEFLPDDRYLFCFYTWDEIGTATELDEFITSMRSPSLLQLADQAVEAAQAAVVPILQRLKTAKRELSRLANVRLVILSWRVQAGPRLSNSDSSRRKPSSASLVTAERQRQ